MNEYRHCTGDGCYAKNECLQFLARNSFEQFPPENNCTRFVHAATEFSVIEFEPIRLIGNLGKSFSLNSIRDEVAYRMDLIDKRKGKGKT